MCNIVIFYILLCLFILFWIKKADLETAFNIQIHNAILPTVGIALVICFAFCLGCHSCKSACQIGPGATAFTDNLCISYKEKTLRSWKSKFYFCLNPEGSSVDCYPENEQGWMNIIGEAKKSVGHYISHLKSDRDRPERC